MHQATGTSGPVFTEEPSCQALALAIVDDSELAEPNELVRQVLRQEFTATLLRFANTSPPSGCVEDFHLQVAEHARHTKKKAISIVLMATGS